MTAEIIATRQLFQYDRNVMSVALAIRQPKELMTVVMVNLVCYFNTLLMLTNSQKCLHALSVSYRA